MNGPQQVALRYHCRLAAETMHPRFIHLGRPPLYSTCLTVNSGYE